MEFGGRGFQTGGEAVQLRIAPDQVIATEVGIGCSVMHGKDHLFRIVLELPTESATNAAKEWSHKFFKGCMQ